MPVPASAVLTAVSFCDSVVAAARLNVTLAGSLPSVGMIFRTVPATPLALLTAAPPVTVEATSAPSEVTVAEALKLPIKALAVLVPAST